MQLKNIKSTYVYLEDISLLEFRALNELTLNFPEKNLTVLAGENGVGKSSVLDGLSYSLSWLVNRILYKGGKGKEIERLDIRDDSTRGYSSIIIKLAINRFAKANLELCELHVGSSANKKSHLNEISKLGPFTSLPVKMMLHLLYLSLHTMGFQEQLTLVQKI